MSTDIYADREVSAADQAWWAMDVPCNSVHKCDRTATWTARYSCGCRRLHCDQHRNRNMELLERCRQRGVLPHCLACGANPISLDVTWTRL